MKDQHYRRTISVDATPKEAYLALTKGFANWWTSCSGDFDQVGDRVRFVFPPNVSYWTFEAKTLKQNETVELECVEAHHKIVDKPRASETEWLGSMAQWRIEPRGARTDIHFTHRGLSPDLDCYEVCQAGWNLFFVDSLRAYLDTGVGKPHQPETTS